MNLLHLKYAVEVAKTHSINKAAENLFMNQPNLSRAIKELEESLDISIFNRTSRGISVTPQGEEFLEYAVTILGQIEEIENISKKGAVKTQRFSVSVPRASYISAAFVAFSKQIDQSRPAEIYYKETNAVRAIDNILKGGYKLGIIRYQEIYDDQFKELLSGKGLDWELLSEFQHVAILSRENPLTKKQVLTQLDLEPLMEIAQADPFIPTMPVEKAREAEFLEGINKRIFVFERGSQYDLLQHVPNSFMWASPVPQEILSKYHLVQIPGKTDSRRYRDVLIYRKAYRLSELDKLFITEVCNEKRKLF